MKLNIAAFGLASLAMIATAQAQATRTWVSGVGDDANPRSRTAPCKTFAGAISKTAAGGEISVLDPGGFGAVTITKSITIGGPIEASILATGTNGIIINAAATDDIYLRNLNIEGAGTGINGVRVLQARNVTLQDMNIRNFTTTGIDVASATDVRTYVTDVSVHDARIGLSVKTTAAVSSTAFVDQSRFAQNSTTGIKVDGSNAVVLLSDSVLTNPTSDTNIVNGGTIRSYVDNVIRNGNANDTTLYK
jgi:hypothetical protein